jgi:hypothetical protein
MFPERVEGFEKSLSQNALKWLHTESKAESVKPRSSATNENQKPGNGQAGIKALPQRMVMGEHQLPPMKPAQRLGEPLRSAGITGMPKTDNRPRLGMPSKNTMYGSVARKFEPETESVLPARVPLVPVVQDAPPTARPIPAQRKFFSMRQDAAVPGEEVSIADPVTPAPRVAALSHSLLAEILSTKKPVAEVTVEVDIEPVEIDDQVDKLLKSVGKSEWSARVKAYEDLYGLVTMETSDLNRHVLIKVVDASLESLADSHFRVIRAGMDLVKWLMEKHLSEWTVHRPKLLPRLVNIAEDTQIKTKLGLGETAMELIGVLKDCATSPESWAHELFDVINVPEYSKNVRMRNAVLRLVLQVDFKFTRSSDYRMALSRLSSCVPESDKVTLVSLRKLVNNLHDASPEQFFDSLSYLSTSYRSSLRNLVGSSINNYLVLEDRAVNARRLNRSRSGKLPNNVETRKRSKSMGPPKEPELEIDDIVPISDPPLTVEKVMAEPLVEEVAAVEVAPSSVEQHQDILAESEASTTEGEVTSEIISTVADAENLMEEVQEESKPDFEDSEPKHVDDVIKEAKVEVPDVGFVSDLVVGMVETAMMGHGLKSHNTLEIATFNLMMDKVLEGESVAMDSMDFVKQGFFTHFDEIDKCKFVRVLCIIGCEELADDVQPYLIETIKSIDVDMRVNLLIEVLGKSSPFDMQLCLLRQIMSPAPQFDTNQMSAVLDFLFTALKSDNPMHSMMSRDLIARFAKCCDAQETLRQPLHTNMKRCLTGMTEGRHKTMALMLVRKLVDVGYQMTESNE